MKLMKRLLAVILSVVMILSLTFSSAFAATRTLKGSDYTTVFVHGMMGWGEDDDLNMLYDYWGITSGSQMDYLTGLGYDVCEASVGPLSSCWDRTCELYAQLTGTRVDYGAYHAQKYGHERYGRDYTGKSILNYTWSAKNKINLVGHSFGGATSRYLADLLKDGNAKEVAAAKAAGTSVSPLFTGGKGDWVYSITTISSPNNGTSFLESIPDLGELVVQAYLLYGEALAASGIFSGFLDYQLDQFGITLQDGEDPLSAFVRILTETDFLDHNDNCLVDLTIDKTNAMNQKLEQSSDIFYFTYTGQTTYQEALTGAVLPKPTTNPLMLFFSTAIGNYTGTTSGSYPDGYGSYETTVKVHNQTVGTAWQPNDGLTNVCANKAPYYITSAGTKVTNRYINATDSTSNFKPGYWYVMPVVDMDHVAIIGGMFNENPLNVQNFYKSLMQRINSCTRTA